MAAPGGAGGGTRARDHVASNGDRAVEHRFPRVFVGPVESAGGEGGTPRVEHFVVVTDTGASTALHHLLPPSLITTLPNLF